MLWMSANKFKDSNFYPLIGINFGYDNGLSGYRIGFGIFFDEEDTGYYNFSKQTFKSFDKTINIDPIFSAWIHHRNYGKIEEVFEKFLKEGYDLLFNNIKRMIQHAKTMQYRDNESSERILKSYHRTQFRDYQEALSDIHSNFSKKHGTNHFTHFLCWSYLADKVLAGNEEISLANLIARNLLILKK